MKKLSILFAGILVSAVVFTSCGKDDESTGTNELGKATITGIVEMNSDQTDLKVVKPGDAAPEVVWEHPTGVQLTATINADDLAQDGTGANTEKKTYYTTVGDDGSYSFSIDAGAKNVTVEVTGVDLRKDLITYERLKASDGWNDSLDASGNYIYLTVVDKRKIWTMAPVTVNVVEKDNKIRDIKFN